VNTELTIKQDSFVQEWVKIGNKSEAYRRAYDTQNMAAKTVTEKASLLSAQDYIRARYTQLTKVGRESTDTTVDCLDAMLKEAYQVARAFARPSAVEGSV